MNGSPRVHSALMFICNPMVVATCVVEEIDAGSRGSVESDSVLCLYRAPTFAGRDFCDLNHNW